jgi:3-hydroxyisobutyrate dehydrogenase-like beta-hydroxyacid dehydrogenase
MRVLVIGTGNMGRAISTRLLAGGQSVTLYNRTRDEAEQVAGELRGVATGGASVTVADAPERAIDDSDVVILAVWYPVTLQLATSRRSSARGSPARSSSTSRTRSTRPTTASPPSPGPRPPRRSGPRCPRRRRW